MKSAPTKTLLRTLRLRGAEADALIDRLRKVVEKFKYNWHQVRIEGGPSQYEQLMEAKRPEIPTDSTLPNPDYALVIAEDLFRSMLPQCEAGFHREFEAWHPELGFVFQLEYLRNKSYPRCWIVMAAIVFATAYPEYAHLLLDSLRQRPDIVREVDDSVARNYDAEPILLLGETSWWQRATCDIGSHLYRGTSRSLVRAFGVGLIFAFVQPEAARAIVRVMRATAQRSYDWQAATAGLVVRSHPISAFGGTREGH